MFGFQNQEKDLETNTIHFKYREYSPAEGKFWSIDPLAAKYPHNSPYAFSENRVIDGVELEGLEYATFNIIWNRKTGLVTAINVAKDYELKNEGTLGPGVRYNLVDAETGKTLSWRMDRNSYGIYQGANNPKLPEVGKGRYPTHDDYRLDPIDEADANAKQHDQDYDAASPNGLKGPLGVLDERSSPANEAYIERADKIIDKQKAGGLDDVTGKPVTKDAADAAKIGKRAFKFTESLKRNAPRERATP